MSVLDLKADEARFWKLLEDRARPGADVKAIDRRLADLFGSQQAILFTDLAGFSSVTAELGITHFLQVIAEHRRLFYPILDREGGVVIKLMGDSLLVIFARADAALSAALSMQRAATEYNRHRVPSEHILLCCGIGFGKVLRIENRDVYGEEVNTASRLGEDLAKRGEILVSEAAREAIGESIGVTYEELGFKTACGDRAFIVRNREEQ
jgi:adenylate cyclase